MIDLLAKIFEVCVTAVTAILGLAYPMFVERVNGIVDKYGSPNISKKFKKETSYICFNVLIVLCIVEMFVFPIIMMAVSTQFCNLLLISIQGVCVFTLCMVIIRVYFLVMTYSDPHSFFDRIKTNDTNEEKLLSSLQILIEYGSRNDMYADIYREAMGILMEKIFKFQKDQVAGDKESQAEQGVSDSKPDGEQVALEYPSYIFDVLIQLKRSSSKPGNAILSRQPDIVGALYNIYTGFPITEKVYGLMWSWIKGMVEAKYDDWMKHYWSIAAQYYSLKLDQSGGKEEKEKFCEFHLMVGVMLFYQKRYDVLCYAFTFTNSNPPKYPLVPSTFSQIFDFCENFPIDEDPFYLANHYNMFKTFPGANMEYMIEVLRLKYVALLIVRLYSVNITYSNPLASPEVGSSVEENEYKINRIKAIIGHLEAISDEALEALDLKSEWKQEAKKLLESFIEKCEAEKQDLLERRVVSEGKREGIRRRLMEALNNNNPSLPSDKEGDNKDEGESLLSELEAKLPDEFILENRSEIGSNLGESVIQGLHIQLREFYCRKLLQIGAIKTYSIAYRDFGEALKRLHLTSEYAIVALAVSPNTMAGVKEFNLDADEITYQGNGKNEPIKVYNIPSYTDSVVLIMRKDDVPRFRYRNLEEDEYVPDGLCEIEAEKHLYSNIDKITETDLVLKVKQGFYVHIPKPLKYVCIRIQPRVESDAVDVSNVEPIKNLIR